MQQTTTDFVNGTIVEPALDEMLTKDRLVDLVEDFFLIDSSRQGRTNETTGVVQTRSRATK